MFDLDVEGLGELGGTIGPLFAGLFASAGLDEGMMIEGLDGTNENGVGLPDGLGDTVEEPMHAVGEVDIGVTGRAKHGCGALCATDTGVAGLIFLSTVGFCFGDDANERGSVGWGLGIMMDEEGADEIGSYFEGGAIVEGLGKGGETSLHYAVGALRVSRMGRRSEIL